MTERVLNINAVPSYLITTFCTGRVKVSESSGEVRILPITDDPETDKSLAVKHTTAEAEDKMRRLHEFCGSGADLEMTVDSFISTTHNGMEISDE